MITPVLPDCAPAGGAADDAAARSPEALEAAGSAFAALLASATALPTDPIDATEPAAAEPPAPTAPPAATTPSPTEPAATETAGAVLPTAGSQGAGIAPVPGETGPPGDDPMATAAGDAEPSPTDALPVGAAETGRARGRDRADHADPPAWGRHPDAAPGAVDDLARPVDRRAQVLLATDRGEPAPAAGTHPLQGIAHRPAPLIDRAPAPAPAPEVTTTTTPAPETPVAGQLGEALGRAELHHLPDGDHQLQVDLHPAELGAVGVDVTVHHDRVHVVLRPEHPAAAELLGQSLADLRRQLHEAGIGLADLRLGERRAALADQRAGHGDADRPGRRRGDAVSAGATAAHASPVALARHRLPTSSTTAVDLML